MMRDTRRLVLVAVVGGLLLAIVLMLSGGPNGSGTVSNTNSASASSTPSGNPILDAASDVGPMAGSVSADEPFHGLVHAWLGC